MIDNLIGFTRYMLSFHTFYIFGWNFVIDQNPKRHNSIYLEFLLKIHDKDGKTISTLMLFVCINSRAMANSFSCNNTNIGQGGVPKPYFWAQISYFQ